MRLFCFPHAGAGASIFRAWASELPPWIEICRVQLPGREDRLDESPYSSVEPLLDDLLSALGPLLDRPFALFGHSTGALVAFALARRLGASVPVHLFVSGREAPTLPHVLPDLSTLPEAEFTRRIRDLAGTPSEVLDSPELRSLFFPLLRADLAIDERYVYTPGPPLACPISVFGGTEDVIANRDALEAWRDQTTARFTIRMFRGGHFFLRSEQTRVLAAIAEDLHFSIDRG